MTNLVVEYYHQISDHSGRKYVMSLACEKFWIVNASSVVRKVLSKCFSCQRRQGPFCEHKMADLRVDRVTPGQPPFTSVSIDCFGPLQVRRGVIFTCLAMRAVHIEVAHSMETDSFLMALRRFKQEGERLFIHQSGNRKHHSTETLSLLLRDHIFSAMDNKHITTMVVIDLRKAFDSLCYLKTTKPRFLQQSYSLAPLDRNFKLALKGSHLQCHG